MYWAMGMWRFQAIFLMARPWRHVSRQKDGGGYFAPRPQCCEPSSSARALEELLGHLTFVQLTNRRLLLCLFDSCYNFFRLHDCKLKRFWKCVVDELHAFKGLMIFWCARWDSLESVGHELWCQRRLGPCRGAFFREPPLRKWGVLRCILFSKGRGYNDGRRAHVRVNTVDFLEVLRTMLDTSKVEKLVTGSGTILWDGCRPKWTTVTRRLGSRTAPSAKGFSISYEVSSFPRADSDSGLRAYWARKTAIQPLSNAGLASPPVPEPFDNPVLVSDSVWIDTAVAGGMRKFDLCHRVRKYIKFLADGITVVDIFFENTAVMVASNFTLRQCPAETSLKIFALTVPKLMMSAHVGEYGTRLLWDSFTWRSRALISLLSFDKLGDAPGLHSPVVFVTEPRTTFCLKRNASATTWLPRSHWCHIAGPWQIAVLKSEEFVQHEGTNGQFHVAQFRVWSRNAVSLWIWH